MDRNMQERREVENGKDLAQKFKRMAVLFSVVDALVIIKLVYNFIFGYYLDDPAIPTFWTAVFVLAGMISIFLSWKLWRLEKSKVKKIQALDNKRKSDLKKSQEDKRFS